jgi:hypothetical protein
MAQLNQRNAGTSSSQRLSETMNAVVMHDGGVNAWMDDPENGSTVQRPAPALEDGNLSYTTPGRPIPSGYYSVGTANFRYWTAVEALRRGADFWRTRVPDLKWQVGSKLTVILDDGVDFNAYYDRTALKFFHGRATEGVVYSGESPDILCHEMGHAILDALKPELWNVGSQEVAAFHESFGDISAILSALQLPMMRAAIISETDGRINRNSRLSRLAEQLGQAIRERYPDAVDPDCLRNASNRFMYESPLFLKSSGPASVLTSEPHSFSRVFTGAFLDGLAGMLLAVAKNRSMPTEDELLEVSAHMGDILVAGIRNASVVANFYAQVAGGMVQAAGEVHPLFPRALKAAFIRRDILSLHSATTVEALADVAKSLYGDAPGAEAIPQAPTNIAIDGKQYGLGDRPLIVQTPSQPRRFSASAAVNVIAPVQVPSSEVAARGFVEQLFKQGRVDFGNVVAEKDRIDPLAGLKTHRLIEANGAVRLERVLCDCGLCHDY